MTQLYVYTCKLCSNTFAGHFKEAEASICDECKFEVESYGRELTPEEEKELYENEIAERQSNWDADYTSSDFDR